MASTNGTNVGAVQLIPSLPKYLSKDEHKEVLTSTPEDFSKIPPVLVYLAQDVSVTFTPPLEGFVVEETGTTKGSLHVISSALTFIPSSGGQGFQVPYPAITLHAVSRSESGPSIYCQLDDSYTPHGVNGSNADDDDDEAGEIHELVIIPTDDSTLEAIFEALSHCAALHPDPVDPNDMDDDDDAFVSTDADFDEQEMSEAGRIAMEYLDSIIDNPFAKKEGEAEAEDENGIKDSEKNDAVNEAVQDASEKVSKATK